MIFDALAHPSFLRMQWPFAVVLIVAMICITLYAISRMINKDHHEINRLRYENERLRLENSKLPANAGNNSLEVIHN
jgi:hypothetical protein